MRGDRQINLSSIVAGAYGAALQDDLWEPWAEDLFRKFGGSGGLFGLHDTTEKALDRIISISAPLRATEEYIAGYHQFDPQIKFVSTTVASEVYIGVPDIDRERKEVADYLRWQREIAQMPYHQTAVMMLGDAPYRASICIHKSTELGSVTRDEHRALRRLAPQLEAVLRLAFQHGEKLQSAYWDGIIVGRSAEIAFLIDERGRVIRHTNAAGEIIARRDGLDVVKGHITPHKPTEISALRAIIARAIQPELPASGAMQICRPSGKRPLIFVCYPLPRSSRMLAPAEAAALITIVDPSARPCDATWIYREAFRLTKREAEIANALATGHSAESAAAMLGMSLPTARTHLRRIFDKTGSSGQAALIRMLSKIS